MVTNFQISSKILICNWNDILYNQHPHSARETIWEIEMKPALLGSELVEKHLCSVIYNYESFKPWYLTGHTYNKM